MAEQLSTENMPRASSIEARREKAREIVNRAFCFCDLEVHTEGFGIEVEILRLGAVDVLDFRGNGVLEARRGIRHIREYGGDDIWFYQPKTAGFRLSNAHGLHELVPGYFAFADSARPFNGCVFPLNKSAFSAWLVRIPSSMVNERLPAVERFRHQPFALNSATARVTTSLLDALSDERHLLTETTAGMLGETIAGAIVATGYDAISAKLPNLSSGSVKRGLKNVKNRILQRLSESDLNTSSIAKDCGMSVRTLHGLFENSPYTVSAWIREQRLQKCRKSLQNPDTKERSITEIALDWGFSDLAHFSKLYKKRFGISPTEERGVKN